MTAEELIIGHYEQTLTSEQESHLASMVESSPDVRTLYEQHGNIQALMVEEAETIETSSKLDKIVLGAALGTLAEIAGHSVGFSLLGKVATVVGTLAVGGAGFVLYNSMTGDDLPPKEAQPTVRTVPQGSGPVAPVPPGGSPTESSTPSVTSSESPAASTSTIRENERQATSARDGRSQAARDRQSSGRGGTAAAGGDTTPSLSLDPNRSDATIEHTTRTQPEDTTRPARTP